MCASVTDISILKQIWNYILGQNFAVNFSWEKMDSGWTVEEAEVAAREWIMSGPWQRNFVDACFLQFHMFPTVWSYTTTIGLLDLNIRVSLKVTFTVT